MRITLVRHATLIAELAGRRLLVDPMLDDAGARPPIENTANDLRNPLVPLPFDPVPGIDAVLVTHLHQDHFDAAAAERLPRETPLFCQPEDEERLRALGLAPRPVEDTVDWDSLTLHRTGGRHGTGALADALAPVCGFDLGSLYLAGDTVWCTEVEEALARHRPAVAVVNAGEMIDRQADQSSKERVHRRPPAPSSGAIAPEPAHGSAAAGLLSRRLIGIFRSIV